MEKAATHRPYYTRKNLCTDTSPKILPPLVWSNRWTKPKKLLQVEQDVDRRVSMQEMIKIYLGVREVVNVRRGAGSYLATLYLTSVVACAAAPSPARPRRSLPRCRQPPFNPAGNRGGARMCPFWFNGVARWGVPFIFMGFFE